MESTKETIGNKLGKAGEYISDSYITAKVKAEILADPLLKVFQIGVETTNKEVTLSGTVDSQKSIERSQEIARSIKEVLKVTSNLEIKSVKFKVKSKNLIVDKAEKIGDFMSDTYITTKIKTEILSDPLLKVFQISVSTNDGVVQLDGEVDTQQSILRTQDIARNIKNVKSVKNELTVKHVI